jgi:hypothetical protein
MRVGRRYAPAERVHSPLILRLMILSVFLPIELSFEIGGLRLTATRVILLIASPVAALKMAQKIATGQYRFIYSDMFVLLTGFWMIFAATQIDGISPGFNHAGPLVLEFCGTYFVARTLLAKHGEALLLIRFLCCAIAVVALLGLPDPLTDHWFIRSLSAQLTETSMAKAESWLQTEGHRLGFARATSTIEHPILFGLVCAVGLLLALSVRLRFRIFIIAACSIGALLSFSSAPIQAIVLGTGLIFYDRMLGGFQRKWLALKGLGLLGVCSAFVLSSSPVGWIISHLTFEPGNGYYREWVWTVVINALAPSPWYGVGYGPYPDYLGLYVSVDALWLVQAMFSGIPGSVFLALSMIGAASSPAGDPASGLSAEESRLRITLGILIFLIIFMSFTVDLWGSTWILAGLITGIRAHFGELGWLNPVRLGYPAGRVSRNVVAVSPGV